MFLVWMHCFRFFFVWLNLGATISDSRHVLFSLQPLAKLEVSRRILNGYIPHITKFKRQLGAFSSARDVSHHFQEIKWVAKTIVNTIQIIQSVLRKVKGFSIACKSSWTSLTVLLKRRYFLSSVHLNYQILQFGWNILWRQINNAADSHQPRFKIQLCLRKLSNNNFKWEKNDVSQSIKNATPLGEMNSWICCVWTLSKL